MSLNKYHAKYTLRKFWNDTLRGVEKELTKPHGPEILYALNKLKLLLEQYRDVYT